MKRWAIITVTLYALLLLLMTVPLAFLACLRLDVSPHGTAFQSRFDLQETLRAMIHWSYWLWLAVFTAAQGLLLLVPVKAAERRPVSRRHLLVPVVTGAFLLGNLFLAGILTIIAAITGDEMDKVLMVPAQAINELLRVIPGLATYLGQRGFAPGDEALLAIELLALMGVAWLFWGLVFYSFSKTDSEEALVRRTVHWLLTGSILELLVAVPSHIIIRQRDDCCAPFASFWGILTGICVMLMSFGPGVLFLYARRMHDKQARQNKPPVIDNPA